MAYFNDEFDMSYGHNETPIEELIGKNASSSYMFSLPFTAVTLHYSFLFHVTRRRLDDGDGGDMEDHQVDAHDDNYYRMDDDQTKHDDDDDYWSKTHVRTEDDDDVISSTFDKWFGNHNSSVWDDEDFHFEGARDVDVDGVKAAFFFNGFICAGLLMAYEILRRVLPSVYSGRHKHLAVEDLLAQLPTGVGTCAPFDWIRPVFNVPWDHIRDVGGLDAYMFLRYIRLCFRITAVSAFWGILILFPVYATGGGKSQGWYFLSMSNVRQGNSWRLWLSTAFLYLFSAFVFYCLKREYRHYLEMRMDFLGQGDTDVHPQHHYSLIVENIPLELRSDTALYDYFNKLFPNRVHSAVVVLNVPELEALSARKLRVTRRLEKAIAFYEATGLRPSHVVGRPRMTLLGIESNPIDIPLYGLCAKFSDSRKDDRPAEKGERIDSISYYTTDLANVNEQVVEMQKLKMEIAAKGNSANKASSWLEKAVDMAYSTIADTAVPIAQNAAGVITGRRSDTNSEKDKKSGEPSLDPNQPPSVTESTAKPTPEGAYGSFEADDARDDVFDAGADDSRRSWTGHGSGRSSSKRSESHRRSPITLIQRPRFSLMERKTTRGSSHGSQEPAGSNYTFNKMDASKSKTIRLVDDDYTCTLLATRDLTETTGLLESLHSRHSLSLQADGASEMSDILRYQRGRSRRSIGRKIIGALGFDFAMAGFRALSGQLDEVVDTIVGTTMSSTGFVTFLDLGSVTCAASAPLTHKPNTLDVSVAPEPRDIIWENAEIEKSTIDSRESTTNALLFLGAVLWSIPLAAIQALATAKRIAKIPGMDWILSLDGGSVEVFINGYLPIVALLGLILLLPIIFETIAVFYEQRKTQSEVQASIVGRYFYFQLTNIYVTVTAGAVWMSLADILEHPAKVLQILGESLPFMVGYFISLLITKLLAGLPLVMLRVGALSRMLFLRFCFSERKLTQRELDEIYRKENVLYGWEYPTQLLVIVICFTYAVISPIILPVGACYFFCALMVYKKQVLYVYSPIFESGGANFPRVVDRTIVGLICGQLTFFGYTLLKEGTYQPIALFPLMSYTIYMIIYLRRNFGDPSNRLSLERARELDRIAELQNALSGSGLSREAKLQQVFHKEAYRQPVLAEKGSLPLPYRHGFGEDAQTAEATRRLRQSPNGRFFARSNDQRNRYGGSVGRNTPGASRNLVTAASPLASPIASLDEDLDGPGRVITFGQGLGAIPSRGSVGSVGSDIVPSSSILKPRPLRPSSTEEDVEEDEGIGSGQIV